HGETYKDPMTGDGIQPRNSKESNLFQVRKSGDKEVTDGCELFFSNCLCGTSHLNLLRKRIRRQRSLLAGKAMNRSGLRRERRRNASNMYRLPTPQSSRDQ